MATAPLSREYVQVWMAHHGEPPYDCAYCGKPITQLTGRTKGCGVVHHKDEDRSNKDISNLAAMHRECHASHHNKGKSRRVMTDGERAAHAQRLKERFADPELSRKMSEIRKGRPWSEARRAAYEKSREEGRPNHFAGKRHTEETKDKMRKAARAREERKRRERGGGDV
jgi:hypothetical protein